MNLKFSRLLWLVLAATAAAALLGAYPTWLWMAGEGLLAMAVAAGIVLLVVLGSGGLILALTRGRSDLLAGRLFVAGGIVRMGLAVGLGLAAWRLLGLPRQPLLLWIAGLYFLLLLAESAWLSMALRSARR